MARIAVIGATGSVGRQVCGAFAGAGHEIVAVSRGGTAAHLVGHDVVALDVAGTDAGSVAELLTARGVTVVVNAAGRWGPTRAEMVHSHLGVVQRLVGAVAVMEPAPRLVHLGSVHEYGEQPGGTPLAESAVPRPVTAYSQIKLACSLAVLSAGGVVLRAANMFGPYPPEETFFASLLRRLRAAECSADTVDLSVAADRRDFVDVRDVAAAVLAAASAPVDGQVVNIGSGRATGMRELILSFAAAARFPRERLRLTQREVPSHGGDWIEVDIRAARHLLGWQPRISVAESMTAMWTER